MTVRIAKQPVNIREKLSELERPIGLNGSALMRTETPQEAFSLIGAGRKNLLINPLFEVSQRGNYQVDAGGTALAIASGDRTFSVDRWSGYSGGATTSMSTQFVTLPTGEKVRSLKITATSSSGNSWLHPFQTWEPQTWMEGQLFTLSCWVKTNRPGQRLRFCDSNTCYEIGDVVPNDGNWYFMKATQRCGTNLNYSGGGQFQPAFTTGSLDTGHYVEFAKPQMEVGKVATPFEYRSYGQELALCQRYFQTLNDTDTFNSSSGPYGSTANAGWQYSASDGSLRVYLPVSMRTNPTATVIGTPTSSPGADGTIGTYGDAAWMPVNSINVTETTKNSVRINVYNLNGSGKDAFGLYFYGSKTTSTVILNAEL
jgi:hypothetical protein